MSLVRSPACKRRKAESSRQLPKLRSQFRPPKSEPRLPRRSCSGKSSSAVRTVPPVYLLREKARGRARAGLHCNQVQLVDPGPAECEDVTSGVEWECPLSEEEAEIFVTASRHLYFPNIRREDENDGLFYDGRLSLAVGIPADQVPLYCT